jgi:3-oxoadipate enol-lactonase
MWDAQRAALDAAGWHALAPDLPGPDRANDLGTWADRVLGVADGRLIPVGVSMGGYLAFELWRRAPERIAALVLADTRAEGETAESRAARDESIRVVCEDGVAELWSGLEGRIFAPATPVDTRASAREMVLEQGSERLRAALEAIRERPDSRETLGTIDVPTLVVVGADDAITPPDGAQKMAEVIPDAQIVVIPDAGHLAPFENPEATNEAMLHFLRGLD